MAKVRVTDREGNQLIVDGIVGAPLMHVLRELDHGVEAICGGMCSCATCHVYVDPEWLQRVGPRQPDEDELLEELDHTRPNSRLSCQIEFSEALDGLTVVIAPEE